MGVSGSLQLSFGLDARRNFRDAEIALMRRDETRRDMVEDLPFSTISTSKGCMISCRNFIAHNQLINVQRLCRKKAGISIHLEILPHARRKTGTPASQKTHFPKRSITTPRRVESGQRFRSAFLGLRAVKTGVRLQTPTPRNPIRLPDSSVLHPTRRRCCPKERLNWRIDSIFFNTTAVDLLTIQIASFG